jgi:hypothetical protein
MSIKIAFITSDQDINVGSYRIWINDLNHYFKQLNIDSVINPKNIDNYNIIIYQKGLKAKPIKNKKVGIINPNTLDKKLLLNVDFIIVGSIEEHQSLIKFNKNCFIFPLIENLYQNIIPKKHIQKKIISIGYHGNCIHLNHMLTNGGYAALERLSKSNNIKLIIITNNFNSCFTKKLKIPITYKKWNIKTIINDIQEFDIGIVPNISRINFRENTSTTPGFFEGDVNKKNGFYSNDIRIRFKNKSNIGRSLVLFQLGIPVIADITPSNMHILANPDNGYAVLKQPGWFQALQELMCEKKRNFVSTNAYNECKRLYNPLIWAKRLIENIENIENL